jgi:hypothetical protein
VMLFGLVDPVRASSLLNITAFFDVILFGLVDPFRRFGRFYYIS